MTQRDFSHILETLPELSPDQLHALRDQVEHQMAATAPATLADDELQRRLLTAGIVSEIKPPIQDFAPYRNRKAISIQGEPLSETVIRERR